MQLSVIGLREGSEPSLPLGLLLRGVEWGIWQGRIEDVVRMSGRSTIWRRLAEALLLAYLLTLPAGRLLPHRDPLIYGVALFGVLDAAFGPPAARLRGLWPVGAFLFVHLLSVVFSTDRSLSIELSVFTPVVALVFVVAQRVLDTPAAAGRLQLTLGLVAALISIDGAVQAVTGGVGVFSWHADPVAADRVRASLPHPNDLVLVPILLPFLFEALRERGRRWLAAGAVVVAPAVLIALVASKSRNAWLTTAGVVFVWTLLILGWRWALGAFGGLLLAGLALYAGDVYGARARAADFLKLGRDGRVGLYLVAWAMFRESPLLGKGVFTFGDFYRPEWYAGRVRFPAGYVPERGIIPWAHNIPLELLAERGVLGLGTFVWMIGSALAGVRRRLGEPRTATAVVSLAGFLGASMLDLTLMKDWVALLLMLLLAYLWRLGAMGDGARGESVV